MRIGAAVTAGGYTVVMKEIRGVFEVIPGCMGVTMPPEGSIGGDWRSRRSLAVKFLGREVLNRSHQGCGLVSILTISVPDITS